MEKRGKINMDFSKFENRYKVTGELTVLTALHIGSGKELYI